MKYLGTALGGVLKAELTAATVREWWDETDADLRDAGDDGVLTLWARSADGTFRLAPVTLTPMPDEQAA